MHFVLNEKAFFRKFALFFNRKWTIRTRLTVLYLAIFGSTLILFSTLLYQNFIRTQQNEFDIALYNHAVDIAQGIYVDFYGNLNVSPEILSNEGKIFPFSASNAFVQILAIDGTIIARSRNLGLTELPFYRDNWQILLQSRGIFQTLSAQELRIPKSKDSPTQFRLLTALSPGKPTHDFILQLAVPETLLTPVVRDIKKLLGLGIPITLIFATFAGFFLSRKALVPVKQMIQKAHQLSPHNLQERIPVPEAHDEIRSLALTLNTLLDRLQKAFESQERFIADASHELKTPLAILRGELDVFRNRPRSAEEISGWIESMDQELFSLSKIVEDLLILARVDTGSEVINQGLVQVDEVVFEVISKLEVLAKKKDVKIRFNLEEKQENSFQLHADFDLLKILVKNLVENAIKYSPSDQIVEVLLKGETDRIQLDVTDYGPGISPEVLPKVFDRFYRGPNKEGASLPGAGLGLAIAKRITELYKGKISVSSIPGEKTKFTVEIKRF